MTIKVIYASGRAKCRVCKEKIAKDEIDIHFIGGSGMSSISLHHHYSCIKKKVEEMNLEKMK